MSPCVLKNTLEALYQDYDVINHKFYSITKQLEVVRFPSLPDNMYGICYNKENFNVDVVKHSNYGGKLWGLVFMV